MKRGKILSKGPDKSLFDSSHAKLTSFGMCLTDRPSNDRSSQSIVGEGNVQLNFDFDWCQRLMDSPEGDFGQIYLLDMFGLLKAGKGYFALIQTFEKLERVRGAEAWECFFSACGEGRRFLFFTKDRFRTLPDQKIAYQLASNATDSFVVIAFKFNMKKVRHIPWSRDQGEAQLVEGSTQVPHDSHFQHHLSTYRYAGRLRKSSFSPYLPYPSVLSQRMKKCESSCYTPPPDDHQLLRFAQSLIRKRTATLQSMTVVVGGDQHSRCFLLGISNPVWSEKKTMTMPILKPLKSISTQMLLEDNNTEATSRKSLGKSLNDIFSKPVTKPPYIDASEIQTQNIRIYEKFVSTSRSLSSTAPDYDPSLSPIVRSLNDIAVKFDQQKQQLEAYRAQVRVRSRFESESFRDIVQKAYTKCAKDEVIQRFFPGSQELHIQHLSDQFQQALTTPKNYYLSRRIRKVHQHFGISPEVFQRFTKLFREAARESGLSETEEEIMVSNMMWYQADIVTVPKT